MKILALLGLAVILVLLPAVLAARDLPPAANAPAELLAASGNAFGVNLYKRLAEGQSKNLFLSPSSIHTALGMALLGAKGKTAAQMRDVMDWSSEDPAATASAYQALLGRLKPGKQSAYQLSTANSLWGQKGYPWKGDFLERLKDSFGAPLNQVDYQTAADDAAKKINAWVEKETHDKIKNLIRPGMLTSDTRLVLANAIYFKGTWMHQFTKDATQEADFRTAGKTVKTPMMYQKARFGYAADDQVQVLSLPYKGNDLSMVIVLPKKDDGLADVAKDLTADKLKALATRLAWREVLTYVPRFKMTSEFSLAQTLKAMGMKDAFEAGAADFSGMDGQRELFISAVAHKAFVDVNEEGTEAAAATGIMVGVTSVQIDEPPTFRADHPFLFAIRHNATGAILFLGQVVDPTAEK